MTGRPSLGAGALLLALAAAAACGKLGPDFDQVIAIEVSSPDSLEELDTLRPHTRALNGRGDSVPAPIVWATLDTTLRVVDSATGVTVALVPGSGRLQARVGSLRSNLLTIRIVPAADTVFAAGPTRDTLSVAARPDSLSDSLTVQLQDTTVSGPANLRGRRIVFTATVFPPGAGPVTLVTSDTARAVAATDSVLTNGLGIAAVKLRLLPSTRPDSAVVTASAQRAVGTTVPGSPVAFVVEFQP